MGMPMAKNLINKGYQLAVFDRNTQLHSELAGMAAICGSCTEVAHQSRILITMLPNSPHVREAVLGTQGAVHGMREGDILVDMSSIAPLESQAIASELEKKGVEMLDAPGERWTTESRGWNPCDNGGRENRSI